MQLPQGTLEAVEGHRGDRTDHVVAYFELPHACNVNKFYRNVCKTFKINFKLDGSPGLVVMAGDSCPKGCGFESQHSLLDILFTFILL